MFYVFAKGLEVTILNDEKINFFSAEKFKHYFVANDFYFYYSTDL